MEEVESIRGFYSDVSPPARNGLQTHDLKRVSDAL